MKLEVKTKNDDRLQSSFAVLLTLALLSFMVFLFNISIKLGSISKQYQINYLCNLLKIDNSSLNYKKLSKLTRQNTKQKMWDLCRAIVK